MNKEDSESPDNVMPKTNSYSSSSSATVEYNVENELQGALGTISDEIPVNENVKTAEPITLGKCTIKEIISEILDCTIVNKPTATPNSMANVTERSSKTLSILFPSSQSDATGCTMKEVISRILDYTVRPIDQPISSETDLEENIVQNIEVAGSSKYLERNKLPSELGLLEKDHIFSILNTKTINSDKAIPVIKDQPPPTSTSMRSIGHLLPTYSTVLKSGPPPPLPEPIGSVSSFVPRQPPPSYAEVEGIWDDLRSMISSESVIFGPDPIYIVCPSCRRIVITSVNQENSSLTHLTAILLFVCFCWPCCFLPYCFKWCSYTYHTCPTCHHYFGMHRSF